MKRVSIYIVALLCVLTLVPSMALADEAGSTQALSNSVDASSAVDSDRTEAAGYYLEDKAVYRISAAVAKKGTVVVDVKGGIAKKNTNVQLQKRNFTLSQYWRAIYKGNGIYRFYNLSGNYYLGVSGKAVHKANVRTQKSGNINWRVQKNTDGTFSLVPATNKKLRLSVTNGSKKAGTNVRLFKANKAKAQKFYFQKSSALTEAWKTGKTLQPGIFEITSSSNQNLRLAVAGSSTANKANVRLESGKVLQSHKWQLSYVGRGLYRIVNALSGLALDVKGGSSKVGANVQQYKLNNSLAQFWYLKPLGGGAFQLKSATGGRALSTKDASLAANVNVQMAKAASEAAQSYQFTVSQIIADGTYVLSTAMVSPLVLDVASSSKSNGANVQLGRSTGAKAQKFTISHLGGGLYRIVNANSGKSLEVVNGSSKHGANVAQNAWANTQAQKWYVEIGTYGYRFKNAASGKYLDVKNSQRKRGANVVQAKSNTSKAQCWDLHNADWKFFPNGTSANNFKILLKAEQYEGWPYKWGGRSPATSFDCAGLVMYCSNAVWGTNYDLMYTNAEMLYSKCKHISANEARPGDLVFYRGTYGNINYISHVVIYAGNGVMYGAGDPIGYDNVNAVKNINGKKAVTLYARIR